MNEQYALSRFLDAQALIDYDVALRELRNGRKEGHWIWFVFPQLGLGNSAISDAFALTCLEEAQAYLEHTILGARLRECTQAVLETRGLTANEIFGFPDWLKFRSCMTLFDCAAGGSCEFREAIQKFFGGEGDAATLRLLRL